MGIFSNRNFVLENSLQSQISTKQLEQAYLSQIEYVETLFGGIDSIVLSTDDMGWCSTSAQDMEYLKLAIYPYDRIVKMVRTTLELRYDGDDVEKLLYKNGKNYLKKLKG